MGKTNIKAIGLQILTSYQEAQEISRKIGLCPEAPGKNIVLPRLRKMVGFSEARFREEDRRSPKAH